MYAVEAVLLFLAAFVVLSGVFELRQEALSWVGQTGQSWWTYPGGYFVEGVFVVGPLLLSVPFLAIGIFVTSRLWLMVVARRELAYLWTALGGGLVSVLSAGSAAALGLLG